MTIEYGACILHAGKVMQECRYTNKRVSVYISHCENGYANALPYYLIYILPLLLQLISSFDIVSVCNMTDISTFSDPLFVVLQFCVSTVICCVLLIRQLVCWFGV